MLKTWDAQIYLYLSQAGYRPGSDANNLYPLWPLTIRFCSVLLGGRRLLTALLLANLLSLGAAALFHAEARERCGAETAWAATLFLLAFPGALFLNLPYSEALFLFLSLAALRCLRLARFGPAAAAAFLLPLARPQGILFAAPYCYALSKAKRKAPPWAFAAPLAGFGAYLLFMGLSTGDPFDAFVAARRLYPNAPSPWNILQLPAVIKSFVQVTCWQGYSGSLLDRLWFVLVAACLKPLRRMDKTLFLYAAVMGLVPPLTQQFFADARPTLLAFPVFLVLGRSLPARRAAWAGLAGLQAYLLFLHVNNYWAG